ncbi:MAG TPA: hypothetical protein VMM36_13165 [Opitutaceae bacterium]|nr:hypothetical protein [Opitutaceae bacterium]
MKTPEPLIYFILGTPSSGRRGLVADLALNGLAAGDSAVLLMPGSDESTESLIPVSNWTWNNGAIEAAIPAGATHAFMLADPALNPVDQIEALVAWLPASGARIGRVFTVVDCAFGHAYPDLFGWFEACVHFSDVVFFTNTTGVPGSWLSDFEKHFKKLFYPCLFERPVKGEVPNPALVLETLALRMTPAFEDEFALAAVEYEIEGDDEDEEDDSLVEEDEPLEDRYFARNGGGGNRVIPVPDIAPFLKTVE